MSNEPISEQYLKKALVWADLENGASLAEECKSAAFAQLCAGQGDMPVNRAEMNVRASAQWGIYLKKMVAARTAANKAKVELEYLRMRHREWIGEDANHRLQSKL